MTERLNELELAVKMADNLSFNMSRMAAAAASHPDPYIRSSASRLLQDMQAQRQLHLDAIARLEGTMPNRYQSESASLAR